MIQPPDRADQPPLRSDSIGLAIGRLVEPGVAGIAAGARPAARDPRGATSGSGAGGGPADEAGESSAVSAGTDGAGAPVAASARDTGSAGRRAGVGGEAGASPGEDAWTAWPAGWPAGNGAA